MKKGRLLLERELPNLVCLCIDRNQGGEIGGRIYSRYSREPENFDNIVQMIQTLEAFYNRISFPQSSMQLRGFAKEEEQDIGKSEDTRKLLDAETLPNNKGEHVTFLLAVRFRQNATWQGEIYWVEEKKEEKFKSVLELLILIDNALFMKSREKW